MGLESNGIGYDLNNTFLEKNQIANLEEMPHMPWNTLSEPISWRAPIMSWSTVQEPEPTPQTTAKQSMETETLGCHCSCKCDKQ